MYLRNCPSNLNYFVNAILTIYTVGIFSDSKITPKGNPLDTLCATLEEKMQYEEGERDLVVSIISAPKILIIVMIRLDI